MQPGLHGLAMGQSHEPGQHGGQQVEDLEVHPREKEGAQQGMEVRSQVPPRDALVEDAPDGHHDGTDPLPRSGP